MNAMKRGRAYNDLTMEAEKNTFYRELNALLVSKVGEQCLHQLKNLRYATSEQVAQLTALFPGKLFNVRTANVEKNWSDSYWTLTIENGKSYTTEGLDNPDVFESLLDVVNGHPIRPSIPVSHTEAVEDHVVLFGETIKVPVVFNLTFAKWFHSFLQCLPNTADTASYVGEIRKLFGIPQRPFPPYNESTLAYIGNRLLMTHVSRVFYNRRPHASERDLTNLYTFYVSKVVKRELTRLLRSPADFDVIVGLLGDDSVRLINTVFLNLVIDDTECFQYGKEANLICQRLSEQSEPKRDKKATKKPFVLRSFFKTTRDSYSFAYENLSATISFKGRQYAVCRGLLERKAYDAVLKAYGAFNISNLMNDRFRLSAGYTKMATTLKHRGFPDFRMFADSERFIVRIGVDRTLTFDDIADAADNLRRPAVICLPPKRNHLRWFQLGKQSLPKMDAIVLEFLLWIVVVLVTFYVFNGIVFLKRMPSILFAVTIAGLVLFAVFQGIMAEVFLTGALIAWVLYGVTQGFRQVRSDVNKEAIQSAIRKAVDGYDR